MQAGQNSRLQTTTDAKSFRKNFFSLLSKSVGLRIILICSSGNDSHILGKLKSGKGSSLAKFGYKFCSWRWLRNWISFSPMLRMEFLTQVSLKEQGSKLWVNLCMNCIFMKVIRSGRGRISSALNNGSVWALNLDPEIIQIAVFWSLTHYDRVV